MRKPSVICIREWEQQMSSSGCCGRLEGDFLNWNGETCFPERRQKMEEAGVPPREWLRAIGGLKVNAVIVNGRLLSSGEWPDPDRLAQALLAQDIPVPGAV